MNSLPPYRYLWLATWTVQTRVFTLTIGLKTWYFQQQILQIPTCDPFSITSLLVCWHSCSWDWPWWDPIAQVIFRHQKNYGFEWKATHHTWGRFVVRRLGPNGLDVAPFWLASPGSLCEGFSVSLPCGQGTIQIGTTRYVDIPRITSTYGRYSNACVDGSPTCNWPLIITHELRWSV